MVIFFAAMLFHGQNNGITFLAAMFLAGMFQIAGLFLFSSLVFERWNYSGNVAQRSLILSSMFLIHFLVLSVPLRFAPTFAHQFIVGLVGAVVVYLLNVRVRPMR